MLSNYISDSWNVDILAQICHFLPTTFTLDQHRSSCDKNNVIDLLHLSFVNKYFYSAIHSNKSCWKYSIYFFKTVDLIEQLLPRSNFFWDHDNGRSYYLVEKFQPILCQQFACNENELQLINEWIQTGTKRTHQVLIRDKNFPHAILSTVNVYTDWTTYSIRPTFPIDENRSCSLTLRNLRYLDCFIWQLEDTDIFQIPDIHTIFTNNKILTSLIIRTADEVRSFPHHFSVQNILHSLPKLKSLHFEGVTLFIEDLINCCCSSTLESLTLKQAYIDENGQFDLRREYWEDLWCEGELSWKRHSAKIIEKFSSTSNSLFEWNEPKKQLTFHTMIGLRLWLTSVYKEVLFRDNHPDRWISISLMEDERHRITEIIARLETIRPMSSELKDE